MTRAIFRLRPVSPEERETSDPEQELGKLQVKMKVERLEMRFNFFKETFFMAREKGG